MKAFGLMAVLGFNQAAMNIATEACVDVCLLYL